MMAQTICCALLIFHVGAKFFIESPQELQKIFEYKPIFYSIANFGHVPYGRMYSGIVHLPLQLPQNDTGYDFCHPLEVGTIAKTELEDDEVGKWLIVHRGNCTFTTKAKNAQLQGVSLLIVVDSVEEVTKKVVMLDDGFGYQVYIPTILIAKSDGDRIIQYIETYQRSLEANLELKLVIADISFNDTNKQKIVTSFILIYKPDVVFGLSLSNRETFKLLNEFKSFYQIQKGAGNEVRFINIVTFEIYYELTPCFLCQLKQFKVEDPNCLGGGRYCQMDPDGEGVGTGQNVLFEQLRQYCLFKIDPLFWFDYMTTFDSQCIKPQSYQQCSNQLMESRVNLHHQINSCLVNSFDPKEDNQKLASNAILDKWVNYKLTSGIIYYPGATVNNVTYRGATDANDIIKDICSGMLIPISACAQQLNQTKAQQSSEKSYTGLIILIVVLCVAFIIFMVFIYRRMLRRELSQEMGQQVNQMVSQYINFYEAKQQTAT